MWTSAAHIISLRVTAGLVPASSKGRLLSNLYNNNNMGAGHISQTSQSAARTIPVESGKVMWFIKGRISAPAKLLKHTTEVSENDSRCQ